MATTTTESRKMSPLGLVLRGIRSIAGITQLEHAGRLSFSRPYLAQMESGEKRTTYARLVEILSALRVGRQEEIQARLAVFHGDGILSEGELAVLVAYHGCRPVICLYKSHATYGDHLESCEVCGEQVVCRPDGHHCPNGCEHG